MTGGRLALADNPELSRHSPTVAHCSPVCCAAVARALRGVIGMAYRKRNGKWVAILLINGARTTRTFSSHPGGKAR